MKLALHDPADFELRVVLEEHDLEAKNQITSDLQSNFCQNGIPRFLIIKTYLSSKSRGRFGPQFSLQNFHKLLPAAKQNSNPRPIEIHRGREHHWTRQWHGKPCKGTEPGGGGGHRPLRGLGDG